MAVCDAAIGGATVETVLGSPVSEDSSIVQLSYNWGRLPFWFSRCYLMKTGRVTSE